MTQTHGPLVVELEASPENPVDAPPVPDEQPFTPVQTAATLFAHKPSVLGRWFWRLLLALFGVAISSMAWTFVTGLIGQNTVVAYGVLALFAAFVMVCLLIALKEWLALRRLGRVDHIQTRATQALADGDLAMAQHSVQQMLRLYADRADTKWGRDRLAEIQDQILDADGLIAAAETTVLAPLDQLALQQIETATRQVALVTALVPVALADIITALTANIRMIRRIAEIYGG
ncbi:MAG: TIGR01620 family protein, partial [Pseudomonadota bacterium]